ncbi:UNVERIFIED_CONTAM: putative membrane protein YfcA [Brevibacillus sp. OAP136]
MTFTETWVYEMDLDLTTVLLLALFGFVAAFIDSCVGGGGLISLPALVGLGIPMHLALGTNKLASTFSSFTSSATFISMGKYDKKLMLMLFPVSFIGSLIGAKAVLFISDSVLRTLIIVMLAAIFVYTLINKKFGKETQFKGFTSFTLGLGIPFAFIIGFYDGFFGPGTGSFLIFVMVLLFGYDFVIGAGNGRILNFASNLAALLLFLFEGKVLILPGLTMGVAMILGATLGTRMAVKTGVKYVRPLFMLVSITLMGKMIYELIWK